MCIVYSVSREKMEVTSNPEIEMTEACLFLFKGRIAEKGMDPDSSQ